MLDRFNRHIPYLRISFTDRCNFHCLYCMPPGKTTFIRQQELMDLDEIVDVVEEASKLGISKIRFTGEEPLMRPDIVELTQAVAGCSGIREVAATTNGILLAKYARKLKQAGLNRVNISLDTLDPEKFARLTRGGNINEVLEEIEAALETGLTPVKINFVRSDTNTQDDENAVREFCDRKGLHLQTIRQMDLNTTAFFRWKAETVAFASVATESELPPTEM